MAAANRNRATRVKRVAHDGDMAKAASGSEPDRNLKLLTVQKCEELSGESRWTWRSRAYKGIVASVKFGGPKARLLIPESEVRRLIEEHTRPAMVHG